MKTKPMPNEDLKPEYRFNYSKAVRGKYFHRILREGSNVVTLEPDVAKAFSTSAAVNEVLRAVMKAGAVAHRATSRSTKPRVKPARA